MKMHNEMNNENLKNFKIVLKLKKNPKNSKKQELNFLQKEENCIFKTLS